MSRVFAGGTKRAIVDLLPTLPVHDLTGVRDADAYRAWFVTALEAVSDAILELNPPEVRPSVHPGYKWGHGTKVLCLFVRDLVSHSRYFETDVVRRLEPLLYCPIDGIVIDRLRRLGVDPGVRLIREVDEDAFWSIQARLREASDAAAVPRVWFDDIWSEART